MGTKKTATTKPIQPYSIWTNNRFWLLCVSGFAALITVASVYALVPAGNLRVIRIQQTYGLISILFLYLALLAAPLTKAFPTIKGKDEYLHLRRAIGVSAFFFALLHSLLTFFGQLGGFNGLGFLSSRYIIALILGAIGLIVLTAMAVTSFDKVIEKMGFPRWKRLHRLIYIAGLAILVHIIMLGTHFAYGSSIIARITLVAVLLLFMLEAIRIDRWLKKRFSNLQYVGVASMMVLYLLFLGTGFVVGKNSGLDSRAHSGHEEGAQAPTTEPYITFEPNPTIDGQTVHASSQKISLNSLIAGGEIITFTINPGLSDLKSADCFLVNQQTYQYYHGQTKIAGTTIQCLPIGDVEPPTAGVYTLYLRLERANTTNTLLFNLEVSL